MENYVIIKDTRERTGWQFDPLDKCLGMEIGTLKTGDYAMKGFEQHLCIERKASAEEIAGNLGKNWDTFERELERSREFKNFFILCEFSLSELIAFPKGSSIPHRLQQIMRINGKYLLKKIIEIQLRFNIKVIFCDDPINAQIFAHSLFKRLHEDLNVK